MQTTNDRRLENLLRISIFSMTLPIPVSEVQLYTYRLYNNPAMNAADTLPYKRSLSDTLRVMPYAMNCLFQKMYKAYGPAIEKATGTR